MNLKEELFSIKDNVDKLSKATEDEFLSIGGKMRNFYERTKEISSLSYKVAEIVSGDSINDAIKGLNGILDKIMAYFAITERETSEGEESFKVIINQINEVVEQTQRFKTIIRSLVMLGISNRIESARLNKQEFDFIAIANNIEELSNIIGNKSLAIKEKSYKLISVINENSKKIGKLSSQQKKHTELILNETRQTLDELSEKHSVASKQAEIIASKMDGITKNISELVSSMQFHDITRQQMEHVSEAIAKINEEFEKGHLKEKTLISESVYAVKNVCELQAAQLSNTLHEFIGAAIRIKDNLKSISKNILEIKDASMKAVGVASETSESFLIEMGKNLSEVTNRISQNKEINIELSGSIKSVASTVGELSSFVDDIDEIGSDIELIAMNSSVKSAKTGSEGAALGVLADSVKRLSADARSETSAVAELLMEVASISDSLKQKIETKEKSLKEDVELKDLLANLENLIISLKMLNDKILSNLHLIDKKVLELSNEINDQAENFNSHELMERELNSNIIKLNMMSRFIEDNYDAMLNQNDIEKLSAFEVKYTMRQEREVHRRFRGIKSMAKEVNDKIEKESQTPKPSSNKEGELGENVELF